MIIPSSVAQHLVDRMRQVQPPAFGTVVFEVEMNYQEGKLMTFTIAAYSKETIKVGDRFRDVRSGRGLKHDRHCIGVRSEANPNNGRPELRGIPSVTSR